MFDSIAVKPSATYRGCNIFSNLQQTPKIIGAISTSGKKGMVQKLESTAYQWWKTC